MTTNKTLSTLRLDGKWALVCGASKGIGAAAAYALADLGADVTLVARTEEGLKETFQRLPATGTQRHGYFAADFDDTSGLKAALDAWLKRTPKVHILVNNTGGPPGGPASVARPEEYLAAFNRHLIGGQTLVQALLPAMRAAGYGRIINVISTSVKEPIKGLGVSNTVRGAVASWSKTLAGELGKDGITVNNVLPGFTRTGRMESLFQARAEKEHRSVADVEADARGLIPLGRFAEPEEIAAAIAFLASPAASYITGVSLPVDGGRIQGL
ncbi:MAG TPA: SDR family oxidoreductase [Gammaproteobacteria bacterium]|nr:SDR family oxidoreductase [Gammaproteobacteria bacterium]